MGSSHSARTRTLSCICRKPLPKCIICRKSLGSQAEPETEMEILMNSSNIIKEKNSIIDHWLVIFWLFYIKMLKRGIPLCLKSNSI